MSKDVTVNIVGWKNKIKAVLSALIYSRIVLKDPDIIIKVQEEQHEK